MVAKQRIQCVRVWFSVKLFGQDVYRVWQRNTIIYRTRAIERANWKYTTQRNWSVSFGRINYTNWKFMFHSMVLLLWVLEGQRIGSTRTRIIIIKKERRNKLRMMLLKVHSIVIIAVCGIWSQVCANNHIEGLWSSWIIQHLSSEAECAWSFRLIFMGWTWRRLQKKTDEICRLLDGDGDTVFCAQRQY